MLHCQLSLLFFFLCIFLDHNECNTAIHGCQQKCVNIHGTYSCACLNGYKLNSDNKTCSGQTQNNFNHVSRVETITTTL